MAHCPFCRKEIPRTRTERQNSALHLFLTQLADTLNAAGYTVNLVLQKKVDLDWTLNSAKELLWRPAMQALTGKTSTTEMDKLEDINSVYDHLNRHISERFGIEVPPWPSDGDDVAPLKNKYEKN